MRTKQLLNQEVGKRQNGMAQTALQNGLFYALKKPILAAKMVLFAMQFAPFQNGGHK